MAEARVNSKEHKGHCGVLMSQYFPPSLYNYILEARELGATDNKHLVELPLG